MAKLKRSIYFYKLDTVDRKKKVPTRQEFWTAINAINPALAAAMHTLSSTEKLCLWNDTKVGQSNVKFALGKIRHKNIPGTFDNGNRERLNAKNVLESTHGILFEGNVLGAEWNQYGPRLVSALPRYLADICKDKMPVFHLIMLNAANRTMADSLNGLVETHPHSILEWSIRLRPADKLSGSDDERNDQRDARIKIQNQLSHSLFTTIEHVAKESAAVENLEKFEVHGIDSRTNMAATIDLLNAKIFARKDVELEDELHGTVNKLSIYKAIEEAYTELKEAIDNGHASGEI